MNECALCWFFWWSFFFVINCSEQSAGAYIEIEGKKIALGIPNVSSRDMASRVHSLFLFSFQLGFFFILWSLFLIVCCAHDESLTSAVSEQSRLLSSFDDIIRFWRKCTTQKQFFNFKFEFNFNNIWSFGLATCRSRWVVLGLSKRLPVLFWC
jgi:hypothetical protein